MKTYAEKESANQESGKKSEEGAGAQYLDEPEFDEPENVSTGWRRQADRIGRDGEWNFPIADALPEWITQLPGWQESGLVLEIRSDAYSRYVPEPRAEADVVGVFRDGNHYWALVNGERVPVPGDGNCFFYAVWTALNVPEHAEAARKIFRGPIPKTQEAASDYFRRELRDYALRHHVDYAAIFPGDGEDFVDPSDSVPQKPEPPEYAERFGDVEEDFVDASDSVPEKPEMEEVPNAPESTSGGEPDPQCGLGTELKRTLFHVVNDTAALVGQSTATTLMHRTLEAVLPFPSLLSTLGYATSAFSLLTALRRRNLIDGLIQTLLVLPYHLLSPDYFLFAIAEQTKRYIDKKIGWREDTSYLAEYIYMAVGLIAFLAHFGYLYGKTTVHPRTWMGKLIVAIPSKLSRFFQVYSILQKIIAAKPEVGVAVIVEPTCDAFGYSDADELVLTKAEKETQKSERAERRRQVKSMREGARERLTRPSRDESTPEASEVEMPADQARSPAGKAAPRVGLIAGLLGGVFAWKASQAMGGAEMIPLNELAENGLEAVAVGADVGAPAEAALLNGPSGVAAINAASRGTDGRWARRNWLIMAGVFIATVVIGTCVWLYERLTGGWESVHGGYRVSPGANSTSDIANVTSNPATVTSNPATVTSDSATVILASVTGETTASTNATDISVENIVAELTEILTQIEFVDVVEDPELSGLFSSITEASRARRAAAEASTNADLVGKYSERLTLLFLEDPVLYRFFSNLMIDLKPIILTKKSVMARLGDDYAVLIELDTMLLAMQEFIIDKQLSVKDDTNFRALLLINEVRNGLVRNIQNRYGSKAVPYYEILSRRKGFNLIRKFWSENFIEKYLEFSMKEDGVAPDVINTRLGMLRDLKVDGSFLIAYQRQTASGFVGEQRMIQALIEVVQSQLAYWAGSQRIDRSLGNPPLDILNQIYISHYEFLNGYLLDLAKKVKNKNRFYFSYPVKQVDYIEGEFVAERIEEILKTDNGGDENIPVSYYFNNTREIRSFSLRAIVWGEHKHHLLYAENSTTIEWPETISEEQQEALLAIPDEIELSSAILKYARDLEDARAALVQAKFQPIVEFTEDILREKAKELNVTEPISFDTKVKHKWTEQGASRNFGSRTVIITPTLGEIAFGRVSPPRPDALANSRQLDQIALFAYGLDSQTLYEEKVNKWRSDPELKKAFDLYFLSKFKMFLVAGSKLSKINCFNTKIAGMLSFNFENKIVVVSLQDGAARIFASKAHLEWHLRSKKGEVWDWFLSHAVDPQQMVLYRTSTKYLPFVGPRPECDFREAGSEFSYYDDFLDQLVVQGDQLAKSSTELNWEDGLRAVRWVGFMISLVTFQFGILPALAVLVAGEILPTIGLASISDDLQEKDRLIFEAAMAIVYEAIFSSVGAVVSVIARKIINIPISSGGILRSLRKLISRKFIDFRGGFIDSTDFLPKQPAVSHTSMMGRPKGSGGKAGGDGKSDLTWDEGVKVVGTRKLNGRDYKVVEFVEKPIDVEASVGVGQGEAAAASADKVIQEGVESAIKSSVKSSTEGGVEAAGGVVGNPKEYEVAYTEIGGSYVHVTAVPKGAGPAAAEIPKDFILTAHGFRTGKFIPARRQPVAGGPTDDIPKTADYPINYDGGDQIPVPPGKQLIFLAPDTYTVADPNLLKLAKDLDQVIPFAEVGDKITGGFKRSSIVMSKRTKELKAPQGSPRKSDYSYATGADPLVAGPNPDTKPRAANYKYSYYEDDTLKVQGLAVLGNRKSLGARADIISMQPMVDTQNAVSLKDVLRMMRENFPGWERLHITACREVLVGSDLRRLKGTPHYFPDWKPKKNPSRDKRSPEQNDAGNAEDIFEISALITVITVDRHGDIVETVQGVILRKSGEYVELHPEEGDTLSVAGYEKFFHRILPKEDDSAGPFIEQNVPGTGPGGNISVELNSIIEPAFESIGAGGKFGLVRLPEQPRGDTWVAVPDGYEFESKDVPIVNRTAVAKPYTNFQIVNVQSDVMGFRRLIFKPSEKPASVITVTRAGGGRAADCDTVPIQPLASGGDLSLPIDSAPVNNELCIFSGNSRADIADLLTANSRIIAAYPSAPIPRFEVVVMPNAATPFLSQDEVDELLVIASNSSAAPARVLVLTPRMPLYRTWKQRKYYSGMGYFREFEAKNGTYVETLTRLIRFNLYGTGAGTDGNFPIVDVAFERSLIIGPYEKSKWNRPELWSSGAVLDMFQFSPGAVEICLSASSPYGESVFKATRSVENGKTRWTMSGIVEDIVLEDEVSATGDLFSQYGEIWFDHVRNILGLGSGANYSARYESGEIISGTVSEDIFDFESEGDLYGFDFPIYSNGTDPGSDALLDKIKSEDDLLSATLRIQDAKSRKSEKTILDICFLLISIHHSYLLTGNIMDAESMRELANIAKNILQSAAFVGVLSALVDGGDGQEMPGFSMQAKAGLLKRIACWVIKQYEVGVIRRKGETKFDFIRRLTADLAAVKSDELPRIRLTAAYWVALFSEYVPPTQPSADAATTAAPYVKPVTVGQSVIESLNNSTQVIQIGGDINLIYENEVFYYSPQQNIDLVTLSSTIYGDSTQQNRLGDENSLLVWNGPRVGAQVTLVRPPQNALLKKGKRVRLLNLYHTEAGDTLRTVAQKQLGNEAYARQIALINIDVDGLVLSGIIKDVGGLNNIEMSLENTVNLDAEIDFGTVIRIPMKIQLDYDLFARRGNESSYRFLASRFYLYETEEAVKKLRDWDKRKLLQTKVEHNDSGTPGTYYDYIAPL